MSPRAQQFIKLQEQVNAQIDILGQAETQLVGELDLLGDQLTNAEINEINEYYNQYPSDDDIDEWMDEMAAHTTQMDNWLTSR